MLSYVRLLIVQNETTKNTMISRYEQYKASTAGTAIFRRELPSFTKVNNKLNNSWFSDIVDTKQGYMAGIPVAYSVREIEVYSDPTEIDDSEAAKTKQEKAEFTRKQYRIDMTNLMRRFVLDNDLTNLNMETIKMMSICGESARLIYIAEKDGAPTIKAMNVMPWETIFVYDTNSVDCTLAVRYYSLNVVSTVDTDAQTVKESKLHKIVVYTPTKIYTYEKEISYNYFGSVNESATQSLITQTIGGDYTFIGEQPNVFGYIPLIQFVNNEERQGDCDKALSLIDAYDRTLSDLSSELEQFRLAYIGLYGLRATDKTIDDMSQTGMFEMTKDGKIEFITKAVDVKAVMELMNKLETNIMRFTRSVNFKDEHFFGNLSGIAIKYKLTQLEEKCKTTEVKFSAADMFMWRLFGEFWKKYSINFDYLRIHRQFTRNIPVNTLEEARIQTELNGIIPTKRRLQIAPFIDDADLAYDELIKEKKFNAENGINIDESKPGIRVVDAEAGGISNRKTNSVDSETPRT